jgi:protein-S-isoprenylcysteine O-methyltransferase Ste14
MFIFKLILSIIIQIVVFGILLFLPAETFKWWHAWVFLVVVFVSMTVTIVSIFPSNKGILEERLKPLIQKGQPLADKIIVVLFAVLFYCLIAFIPLDVFRFHLMDKPGTLVSSLGLVLFVAGWWIISLALNVNPFAAPVLRHLEEKHQTVIDTGIYGIVRHPMYAGSVPMMVGISLWLESYAAAFLASVPSGLLILRILIEEQFLKRELKGYDAYTEKVRYKLIPFLW